MQKLRPQDSRLLSIARKIRHARGLTRLEGVWRCLRPLYDRFLDSVYMGRGVPVSLGDAGMVHVPAIFTHGDIDLLEIPMMSRLVRQVARDTCFYDVGASRGLHSVAVGEQLGTAGEIHAFEPEIASARQYWLNTSLIRRRSIRVQLYRAFVADYSKDFDSTRCNVASGISGATGNDNAHHLYLFDSAAAADHPAVAIDDYVHGSVRPPSLIKCDIEGAELLFLNGARRILVQYQPTLFLSIHPSLLPRFGHSANDVYAELTNLGYEWQILNEVGETHVLATAKKTSGRNDGIA